MSSSLQDLASSSNNNDASANSSSSSSLNRKRSREFFSEDIALEEKTSKISIIIPELCDSLARYNSLFNKNQIAPLHSQISSLLLTSKQKKLWQKFEKTVLNHSSKFDQQEKVEELREKIEKSIKSMQDLCLSSHAETSPLLNSSSSSSSNPLNFLPPADDAFHQVDRTLIERLLRAAITSKRFDIIALLGETSWISKLENDKKIGRASCRERV